MNTENATLREAASADGRASRSALGASLPNSVKMVIWDLDETFWGGTLSEGEIQIRPANVQMVKTLSERGIVSSICSKNNFEDARRVLEKAAIWSYFVFPRIEFTAKGALIAAIIEQANLRPDNVLFLDDNPLNRREAAHYAPNLMVADPDEILPVLLDLPEARGKDDAALTRLNQYKQLERKAADFAAATGSNEEFLRSCGIRVQLDYDIEPHFDRVVELINRSNQLNFTKKRIAGQTGEAKLRAMLRRRDVHAGIVRVSDRYGDYGIAGFYLVIRDADVHALEQFVFSCRTMNMGIEQFIYERLGKPPCKIVEPVANGLQSFDKVDWIALDDGDGKAGMEEISDDKLMLIGGCDLLQLASYCSSNRAEWVNTVNDGTVIRYDDFGFLLNDREIVRQSQRLRQIPCWRAEEAFAFDRSLRDTRIVIASLWVGFRGRHLITDDGVVVRIHPQGLGDFMEANPRAEFIRHCRIVQLDAEQNAELLRRALDRIAALTPEAKFRVVLGANTRPFGGEASQLDRDNRILYNAVAREYAESSGLYEFLPVDEIVPMDQLVDDWHFTRMGYYRLATELLQRVKSRNPQSSAKRNHTADFDLMPIIAKGLPVKRNARLGSTKGLKGWLTRKVHSNRVGRLGLRAIQSMKRELIAAVHSNAVGRYALRVYKSYR